MNYKPGELDLDLLFPPEIVFTRDDVLSGLQFEHNGDIEEECERVEGYFRYFVDELFRGEIGKRPTVGIKLY